MRLKLKGKALCHPEKRNRSGGLCNSCWYKKHRETERKRAKAEYQRNPTAAKNRYFRQFGLTVEGKAALIRLQGGLCAICEVRKATVIDHDHDTGKIRQALCNACNSGLGLFFLITLPFYVRLRIIW